MIRVSERKQANASAADAESDASSPAAASAPRIAPTDGELLSVFRRRQDAEALERLIARHADMVWRVCRQTLRCEQDAEDAFQATFLLLVRHARAIKSSDSAAGWLYRVAHRTALAARKRSANRREETLAVDPESPAETPFPDLQSRQLTGVLLQELRRLPQRYQTALVLRYLEGRTRREIADQTDTTVAAVQGQLARGKRLLRRRLLRRGVSLSVAMGALAAGSSARGGPSVAAVTATTTNATSLVTGGTLAASAAVLSLYRQGVRTMLAYAMVKPTAAVAVAATVLLAISGEWPGARAGVAAPQPLQLLVALPDEEQAATPSVAITSPQTKAVEEDAKSRRRESSEPLAAVAPPTDVGGSRLSSWIDLGSPEADQFVAAPQPVRRIGYSDNKADGKKSLGGGGHLIKFTLPDGAVGVKSLRIHGSRYGARQAPREDFEITFLSEDRSEIIDVRRAAYGLFRRGAEKWTNVRLGQPVVDLPKTFWVAIDFSPHQTKGIFLSYDTSTGGEHSMLGLAQQEPGEHRPVDFGGDWMVEAVLEREQPAPQSTSGSESRRRQSSELTAAAAPSTDVEGSWVADGAPSRVATSVVAAEEAPPTDVDGSPLAFVNKPLVEASGASQDTLAELLPLVEAAKSADDTVVNLLKSIVAERKSDSDAAAARAELMKASVERLRTLDEKALVSKAELQRAETTQTEAVAKYEKASHRLYRAEQLLALAMKSRAARADGASERSIAGEAENASRGATKAPDPQPNADPTANSVAELLPLLEAAKTADAAVVELLRSLLGEREADLRAALAEGSKAAHDITELRQTNEQVPGAATQAELRKLETKALVTGAAVEKAKLRVEQAKRILEVAVESQASREAEEKAKEEDRQRVEEKQAEDRFAEIKSLIYQANKARGDSQRLLSSIGSVYSEKRQTELRQLLGGRPEWQTVVDFYQPDEFVIRLGKARAARLNESYRLRREARRLVDKRLAELTDRDGAVEDLVAMSMLVSQTQITEPLSLVGETNEEVIESLTTPFVKEVFGYFWTILLNSDAIDFRSIESSIVTRRASTWKHLNTEQRSTLLHQGVLRAFQEIKGLEPTGELNEATWNALFFSDRAEAPAAAAAVE